MKIIILIGVLLTLFFSPGFQCGRQENYPPICSGGLKMDTVYTQISITNNNNQYHIGDTITFFSKVNDSINTASGESFIYDRKVFMTNVQPYRIVNNAGEYMLAYANVEFNPSVSIGLYQNYPSSGYTYTYQRQMPYNTLQVSFIAGRAGLYVFSINGDIYNSYSAINNPQRGYEYCTNYQNAFSFNSLNQHLNYWDSIGVTNLLLPNATSNNMIAKSGKNYSFIKIIP